MSSFTHDLRSGIRALVQRPGLTVVATVILALGVGANAAMFSVIHGVLLRPLPFPSASELVMLWSYNPREGFDKDVTSYPGFLDWKAGATHIASMAAFYARPLNLLSGGEPVEIDAAVVSAEFFTVLGVPPELGRGFLPEEEILGQHRSIVLSQGLWQRRFGGDRGLLGRSVDLGGDSFTVVGVMPAGFEFPRKAELWVPLAPDEGGRAARGNFWLHVVGRKKPGVELRTLQTELDGIATRLEATYPDTHAGLGIHAVPLHEDLVGAIKPVLWLLFAAVAGVLMIACANLANLLLARAAEREREFALRAALGAGAGRILRQLLVESSLLALLGGLAGVLVAALVSPLLFRLAAHELPRLPPSGVSLPVLGFALALSLATGLLFGLAPGRQLARARMSLALKEGGRGALASRGGQRLRRLLVGGEIALSLVLLVGAGLLVKSLAKVAGAEMGLASDRRLTFRLQLPQAGYPEADGRRALVDELLRRLEVTPGVETVGAVSSLLLGRLPTGGSVTVEGRAPDPGDLRQMVTRDQVAGDFFAASGMTLAAGRGFAATDTAEGPPVALINQAMARWGWAGQDPLGRRFKDGGVDSGAPWITVIGVVADAKRSGADQVVLPAAFQSFGQATGRRLTFVVATAGDPLALVPVVRREVAALDSTLPVAAVATLDQLLGERLLTRRFQALLFGLFAALAFTLAAVGVYGVISTLVGQRRGELALRLALGSTPRGITGLVARQVLALTLPGLFVGLVGAFVLARLLEAQLFAVSPADPATYALVSLLLAAVAFLAGALPARRAAGQSPAAALKGD